MQRSISNARFIFKENGLEEEVKKKIDEIYKDRRDRTSCLPGCTSRKAMMGLGLMLLGVTGDQVLASRCL